MYINKCVICDNKLDDYIFSLFNNDMIISNNCVSKYLWRINKYNYKNTKILILYGYNLFFKNILYRYKALKYINLKHCFWLFYKNSIQTKYKNYHILNVPSNKEDDIKRGFNHVFEISKLLGIDIIDCIYKKKYWKQSLKNKNSREGIKDVIEIKKEKLKNIKRILIIDDVATTFSTIKSIIDKLDFIPKIRVIIFASNFNNKKI